MMNLKGLATGIGSLPLTDAEKSVDLVLGSVPAAPFWPQLPKRNAQEGMLAQFTENLPGLKLVDGDVHFTPKDKEKELELFYDRFIAQDLEYFKISPEFARGLQAFYQRLNHLNLSAVEFIKCQVTGPLLFVPGSPIARARLFYMIRCSCRRWSMVYA
jgi:hypothetical protein